MKFPFGFEDQSAEGYDIYPSLKLNEDLISTDLARLASELAEKKVIILDGYEGVYFEEFRQMLEQQFALLGKSCHWMDIATAMKCEEEIEALIAPFMGEEDSIFGTRATLKLADYFDPDKLANLPFVPAADLNIVYGPGARLSRWKGHLLYIDLPKYELQLRARAKRIYNLGSSRCFDMKYTYKRFYFVDWIVLNRHKKAILPEIEWFVDGQNESVFPWMKGGALHIGLQTMAQNFFRVRPWFEPGVWGGNWIKEHIAGLNTDVPNYAWSFELITPENGLLFESSGVKLEASFDCLMYDQGKAVLGEADQQRFGDELPIRFDFLDTFDGGNLSVQCHPLPEYCKEHFGENITQEETYYILDRKNDAKVYLGFQQNIEPEKFEQALRQSFNMNSPLDITEFVQVLPAQKHDLFLIPPGTIHGSGKDNMVLEISTTPYIFTFKLYDWVRPDLNGQPRPLNIDHGMKNLCFDRKGEKVKEELVSKPVLIDQGEDWQLFELPTHPKHTYRVQRYHFQSEITVRTNGKFQVLSLVEGGSIMVESENGLTDRFKYAETFVVPAAAQSYTITNLSNQQAMVVVAFMK